MRMGPVLPGPRTEPWAPGSELDGAVSGAASGATSGRARWDLSIPLLGLESGPLAGGASRLLF